jgi:transposase
MLDPLKPVVAQRPARDPRLLATRIHQDLVRDHGFAGSHQTVRRYVERSWLRPHPELERCFETRSGTTRRSTGPTSSRSGPRAGWSCFHMVMGVRATRSAGLVGSMGLVSFSACHRTAFQHFGGVPRELLNDRTKTVLRTHVGRERPSGERRLHPEALAWAHHYGFRIRLCRAYGAKPKGKVESDVPYVRERLLRAHGFSDHDEANRPWERWNADVARSWPAAFVEVRGGGAAQGLAVGLPCRRYGLTASIAGRTFRLGPAAGGAPAFGRI